MTSIFMTGFSDSLCIFHITENIGPYRSPYLSVQKWFIHVGLKYYFKQAC